VVTKDVAAGAMVAGVPAVPIQRDSRTVEMQP
jgi:acetyltransferase-like isoleucine patch superfamily enzyme